MGSMADHFDLESFEMLKDVMEEEFSDLLSVYVQDSDQRLPLLQQALSNQDAAQLRELAHSFKGASSNVSAAPLAELCRQLEMAAKDNQLSGLDQTLAEVCDEYAQVKGLLQALI